MSVPFRPGILPARRCGVAVGAALALLLCGCGGGDTSSAPAPTATITAAPPVPAPTPVARKLIEFGWDRPTPDVMRAHLATLETLPFDGIVARLHAGFSVFRHAVIPDASFAADQVDIQSARSARLTDNLVLMWATSDAGWNWFSDADWSAAEQNIRQFARTAALGGFKGIYFDTEPYGPNPWHYAGQPAAPGKTFEAMQAQARARGAQFMRIVQAELPGATIFTSWGPTSVMLQLGAPDDPLARQAFLERSAYGLLPAFFEGVLSVAAASQVVDGNEGSYYHLAASDFRARIDSLRAAPGLGTDAPTRAAYAARYQYSNAVYVDWLVNLGNAPRQFGYWLDSAPDRLALLQHHVYHALRATDQYVWIRSELMNWFTGDIPAGVMQAVRDARAKAESGTDLGYTVDALVAGGVQARDTRVSLYGRITQSGAPVVGASFAGLVGPCTNTDADGNYSCSFRRGWSGILEPQKPGLRFVPASVRIDNLLGDRNGVSFTASP